MGFFKWILIITLIIVAIYFVFPDTYYSGKEKLMDWKDKLFKKNVDTNIVPPVNGVDTNYQTPIITNETVAEEETQVFTEATVCSWKYQEYPYTSEGLSSCVLSQDPDLFCLSNPPLKYSGAISVNQRTSFPLLKCCMSTGKCAWG